MDANLQPITLPGAPDQAPAASPNSGSTTVTAPVYELIDAPLTTGALDKVAKVLGLSLTATSTGAGSDPLAMLYRATPIDAKTDDNGSTNVEITRVIVDKNRLTIFPELLGRQSIHIPDSAPPEYGFEVQPESQMPDFHYATRKDAAEAAAKEWLIDNVVYVSPEIDKWPADMPAGKESPTGKSNASGVVPNFKDYMNETLYADQLISLWQSNGVDSPGVILETVQLRPQLPGPKVVRITVDKASNRRVYSAATADTGNCGPEDRYVGPRAYGKNVTFTIDFECVNNKMQVAGFHCPLKIINDKKADVEIWTLEQAAIILPGVLRTAAKDAGDPVFDATLWKYDESQAVASLTLIYIEQYGTDNGLELMPYYRVAIHAVSVDSAAVSRDFLYLLSADSTASITWKPMVPDDPDPTTPMLPSFATSVSFGIFEVKDQTAQSLWDISAIACQSTVDTMEKALSGTNRGPRAKSPVSNHPEYWHGYDDPPGTPHADYSEYHFRGNNVAIIMGHGGPYEVTTVDHNIIPADRHVDFREIKELGPASIPINHRNTRTNFVIVDACRAIPSDWEDIDAPVGVDNALEFWKERFAGLSGVYGFRTSSLFGDDVTRKFCELTCLGVPALTAWMFAAASAPHGTGATKDAGCGPGKPALGLHIHDEPICDLACAVIASGGENDTIYHPNQGDVPRVVRYFQSYAGLSYAPWELTATPTLATPDAPGNPGKPASVALAWRECEGATSYLVNRSSAWGGPGQLIAEVAVGESTVPATDVTSSGHRIALAKSAKDPIRFNSYIDEDVPANPTYYYDVIAKNGYGLSSPASACVSLMPTVVPLRINCGGDVLSGGGDVWQADTFFAGGTGVSNPNPGAILSALSAPEPGPAGVYQTERYGDFTYTFPGLDKPKYNLRLHFSEDLFEFTGKDGSGVGRRIFDVLVNGAKVLPDFDIYKQTTVIHEVFIKGLAVTPDPNRNIIIAFVSKMNNAKVDAIELIALP